MLGPRAVDDATPTLEGRVFLRRDTDLPPAALEPKPTARCSFTSRGRQFWLHVDLDVLSVEDFPAHDFPEPGGLGWGTESITTRALSTSGCIGWSVVIYNPQSDPDRSSAHRVISYITKATSALP